MRILSNLDLQLVLRLELTTCLLLIQLCLVARECLASELARPAARWRIQLKPRQDAALQCPVGWALYPGTPALCYGLLDSLLDYGSAVKACTDLSSGLLERMDARATNYDDGDTAEALTSLIGSNSVCRSVNGGVTIDCRTFWLSTVGHTLQSRTLRFSASAGRCPLLRWNVESSSTRAELGVVDADCADRHHVICKRPAADTMTSLRGHVIDRRRRDVSPTVVVRTPTMRLVRSGSLNQSEPPLTSSPSPIPPEDSSSSDKNSSAMTTAEMVATSIRVTPSTTSTDVSTSTSSSSSTTTTTTIATTTTAAVTETRSLGPTPTLSTTISSTKTTSVFNLIPTSALTVATTLLNLPASSSSVSPPTSSTESTPSSTDSSSSSSSSTPTTTTTTSPSGSSTVASSSTAATAHGATVGASNTAAMTTTSGLKVTTSLLGNQSSTTASSDAITTTAQYDSSSSSHSSPSSPAATTTTTTTTTTTPSTTTTLIATTTYNHSTLPPLSASASSTTTSSTTPTSMSSSLSSTTTTIKLTTTTLSSTPSSTSTSTSTTTPLSSSSSTTTTTTTPTATSTPSSSLSSSTSTQSSTSPSSPSSSTTTTTTTTTTPTPMSTMLPSPTATTTTTPERSSTTTAITEETTTTTTTSATSESESTPNQTTTTPSDVSPPATDFPPENQTTTSVQNSTSANSTGDTIFSPSTLSTAASTQPAETTRSTTAFPLALVLYIVIPSGCATILIIVLVIVVAVVCSKRRKKRKQTSTPAKSAPPRSIYNIHSVRSELGLDDPFVAQEGIAMSGHHGGNTSRSRETATTALSRRSAAVGRGGHPRGVPGVVGAVAVRAGGTHGTRRTVASHRTTLSTDPADDVRQLVDALLELKRLIEDFVVDGVHLDLTTAAASAASTQDRRSQSQTMNPGQSRAWRQQNDVLRAVGDVSVLMADVTARLSGWNGQRRRGSVPPAPRTVRMTAPGYLVEQLAALRPRLDRLANIANAAGRIGARDVSASLETVLTNVRACVDLAIESLAENFAFHHALLPAIHGNNRRRTDRDVPRTVDGYERVRRPAARSIRRRRRIGIYVDPDDPEQEVWSLVDPLAVVCCRLQTVAEVDSNGLSASEAGDVWWQAGLIISLDRATVNLAELARGNVSLRMQEGPHMGEEETAMMRRLRSGEAHFNSLLTDRLQTFHSAADTLPPSAFDRLARSRTSDGSIWGGATANFVRDLLRDALYVSRTLRGVARSDAGTVRGPPPPAARLFPSHRSRAAPSTLAGRVAGGGGGGVATGRSRRSDASSRGGWTIASSMFAGGNASSALAGLAETVEPEPQQQQQTASVHPSRPASEIDVDQNESELGDEDDDDQFEIVVDRTSDQYVDQLFLLYDQTEVETLRKEVKVSFLGEPGIDGGAVSREFFYSVFESLVTRPIQSRCAFQGDRGHLLPAIDHVLTESRVFWFIGVLVVQAARRGCRGLPGLSDAVRHFLAAGARISAVGRSLALVSLDDVADLELRDILNKFQNERELSDAEHLVLQRWLDEAKFSRVLKPSTQNDAMQRILCHYIFDSRMSQLQAIAEGMAEMGFQGPDDADVDSLFPVDVKLTVHDFLSGIVFDEEEDAQTSVTVRKRTKDFFRRYVDDVYSGKIGKLTLEDVLQFFNGAPYFTSMAAATVRFSDSADRSQAMPQAHACSSELVLPTVHRSYRGFRSAMTTAFELGCQGFGVA